MSITSNAQTALNDVTQKNHKTGVDLYTALIVYWKNAHTAGQTQTSAAQNVNTMLASLYTDPKTIQDAYAINVYITTPINSVQQLTAPPGLSSTDKNYANSRVTDPTPAAVGKGIADAAASAVGSLNPLGALFQSNIWLRVAEVGLGIVLIVVGLVKLAPPSVAQNVKTVGKVAALL